MFGANWCLARLSYSFPTFEKLIQAEPTVLVENGRILQQNLAKELLTEEDLRHALRKNQVDLDEELPYLRKVLFESEGSMTIVRRLHGEREFQKRPRPATVESGR